MSRGGAGVAGAGRLSRRRARRRARRGATPTLQGTWTNTTTTPLERPSDLAGKAVLTDEERAAIDEENAPGIDAAVGVGAYNNFWMERGYVYEQTSLVVDPPDGRLPRVLPKAKARQDALVASRRSPSYPTTYEEPSLMERCITRGVPGVMLPGNYNHNYNILQAPGYVAIFHEMIHDSASSARRPAAHRAEHPAVGWAARAATGRAIRWWSRRRTSRTSCTNGAGRCWSGAPAST